MTDVPVVEGALYRAVKRAYHALRGLPDRALRGRRYRAAVQQLGAIGAPRTILVVCHGNICRSPYMAAVLQRAMPSVRVSSAGFTGAGRPAPENSLIASAKRGLDLRSFRSRPIRIDVARRSDLVIVMDATQRDRLVRMMKVSPKRIVIAGDLDPTAAATRGVVDPWQKSIDVFESTFDRLDRCAATLVDTVWQTTLPPRASADGAGLAFDQ